MITFNHYIDQKYFPKLLPLASRSGAIINRQWLELPIPSTNFHGTKYVRAIVVLLYMFVYRSTNKLGQA